MHFWHGMITPVVPICYRVYELLGTVYVCISLDIVFFIITFLSAYMYNYVHAVRLTLLLIKGYLT